YKTLFRSLPQGFMGTLLVVHLSPRLEAALGMSQVVKDPILQQLRLQRAVEPLFLAAALRIERPAMDRLDVQPHQPRRQARVPRRRVERAPGRPVIHKNRLRQAIPTE